MGEAALRMSQLQQQFVHFRPAQNWHRSIDRIQPRQSRASQRLEQGRKSQTSFWMPGAVDDPIRRLVNQDVKLEALLLLPDWRRFVHWTGIRRC